LTRKKQTQELLERLVEWAGGSKEFSHRTGIRPPNLYAYLRTKKPKPVSFKRLKRAAEQIFGEPPAFIPVLEMDALKDGMISKKAVGTEPGIYALFDSAYRVIYVGKASNLYSEIQQTLSRRAREIHPLSSRKITYREITSYVSAYRVNRSDLPFRHDLEALLLRLIVNNTLNDRVGEFKRKR